MASTRAAAAHATRKAAIFARYTTPHLIAAARRLDDANPTSTEERLALVWLIAELERRYPGADAAMDVWAASSDPADRALTYTQALLAALPAHATH